MVRAVLDVPPQENVLLCLVLVLLVRVIAIAIKKNYPSHSVPGYQCMDKNKNVTRCRDSRSAESIETR